MIGGLVGMGMPEEKDFGVNELHWRKPCRKIREFLIASDREACYTILCAFCSTFVNCPRNVSPDESHLPLTIRLMNHGKLLSAVQRRRKLIWSGAAHGLQGTNGHFLGGAHLSSFRVLVVDDFEPFRRLVRSILAAKAELQIVGEAADGLEAVQKAVELKPDLILLDIGLPLLNGIEAAREIRKLVPRSKIIFLSQESSPEVVQEALGLSASSYVVKATAGSELLTAVEAITLGRKDLGGN